MSPRSTGRHAATPPRLAPDRRGAASPYEGVRIGLLTQHGKERVLAPLVADALGARLEVIGGFDTDTLGTFTRDVPRVGSQFDAARRKAQLAVELGGVAVGLGSEGTFGAGPFGFGGWSVELVVLVDAARGIEVGGVAQGPCVHAHDVVTSHDELLAFATRAKFPEHGLVVRLSEDGPIVRKGIHAWDELRSAYDEAVAQVVDGGVFVESDLRAHRHPVRMALIELAGRDLVARLGTPCPACGVPGFGVAEAIPGLPCSQCGMPTDNALADEWACVRCEARERRPRPGPGTADPRWCQWCNP